MWKIQRALYDLERDWGVWQKHDLMEAGNMNINISIIKGGETYSALADSCEIIGKGLNSYNFRNNTIINAGNSGTLARLILGLLSNSNKSVIIKGDKSLSKRDFSRIIKPLNIFGVKVKSNKNKLPVILKGTNCLRPI